MTAWATGDRSEFCGKIPETLAGSDFFLYSHRAGDGRSLTSLLATEDATPAFTELYNRYSKKLLTHALVKSGNREEAEEVVQDVFLNLWNRRNRLDLQHSFHTYIATSVKYEILTKLARQKKKKEMEQKSPTLLYAVHNQIEEWIDYEITRRRIEDTIQELPEKCRLIFRLSREKGLSEKQIAEHLDIAPKTVEAHMTKAIKKLRSSLQHFFSWFL